MNERVVILGVTGFVGKHLDSSLKKRNIPTLGLGSNQVDLTKADSIEQLVKLLTPQDTLVFISALTPDKGRDVSTLQKNLEMAKHVASVLEKVKVSYFVYISSDAVYDDHTTLVRESTPPSPSSYHGFMHLGRELILRQTLDKTAIPYAFLRPSAIYGAGDTHNSYGPNRFMKCHATGQKISLFGQGEEKRDHVFIQDVVRIIASCLTKKTRGTFNVVSGGSVSFGDVAQRICELFGRQIQIEGSARTNRVTHRHFDTSALVREFPDFQPTPLEEGLKLSYQSLGKE